MNGFLSTLIHPENSDLEPFEFLVPIVCMTFMCMIFIGLIVPMSEVILPIIVIIGYTVISLGTFMTKFSQEYLKKISMKGFGFLICAIFAYFVLLEINTFPTDDYFANLVIGLILFVASFVMIGYAIIDLVFAIFFSMKTKQKASWNDSKGELHIDSKHVTFAQKTVQKDMR